MENFKIISESRFYHYQYYNGKKFILRKNERYFKSHRTWMHRFIWESFYKRKIPKGYHVHHIDKNRWNNRPDNLELIEGKKHQSNHMKQRVKDNPEWFAKFQKKGIKEAPKWHKSKEGRIWHKEHAKKHNFGNYELKTKKCQVCSKEYQSKSLHSKYCSNGCKSKGRLLSGVDNVDRECVGCGATFSTNKYKKTKTCSRSCASLISR